MSDGSGDAKPGRPAGAPKAPGKTPGLFRNLGQFVGHVVQGIKSDPNAESAPKPTPPAVPAAPTVRHEVIERIQETPTGPVRIRRTIIEEVHEAVEEAPRARGSETPGPSGSA